MGTKVSWVTMIWILYSADSDDYTHVEVSVSASLELLGVGAGFHKVVNDQRFFPS